MIHKLWPWLASAGLIALVLFIGIASSFIYHIVGEAFHLFPYHTILAIVIFWLWLGFKVLPSRADEY